MSKQQSGFTLIELIAVIVILGILAATAVPRFVSLQDEAALATVRGLAGSIESGSALNHAIDIAVEANLTSTATDPFYNISDCTDGVYLISGTWPAGYSIDAKAVGPQMAETCTLNGLSGTTAEFVIIGANGGNLPAATP